MSEKLKPNFTPVPHVILDEIMHTLNEGEFKTLMAICRFTYGWGKKSDRISLKQLSEITGIGDRSNVHRAIKRLGNLIVVTPGDPSKNLASEYRINCDISDDLLSQKQQDLLSEKQQPVVRPVVSSATFQRKSKERRNSGAKAPDLSFSHKRSEGVCARPRGAVPVELRLAIIRIIDRMNELAGTAYKPDSKIVLNGLVLRLREGKSEADCIAVVENRWNEWGEKPDMRQYFNPETLFRESNFDKYLNAARMSGRDGNGHADPPKIVRIEEESDSYILEDGVRMNRGAYTRKYGRTEAESVH